MGIRRVPEGGRIAAASRPTRLAQWWPAAVLVFWGLTPLLWFRGTLLTTEDLRLPPSFAEWSRTLWVWNPLIGTGVEAALDASLAVFQAIPAAWRALGGSMLGAQQISFVFWFLLAGFGMYRLASRIIPAHRSAWVVATSFYLFNPWLDSVWSGFKPPLVSGYAVVPFILATLLDGVEARCALGSTLMRLGFFCWLGSAAGNNVSETLAVMCPVALLMVTVLTRQLLRRDWPRLRAVCRLFGLSAVTALLSSAFWVLPQAATLIAQVRSGAVGAYEQMSRSWLVGISVSTSFFHVLRLQGDWTWYSGFGNEPYRTYAVLYASHPVYMILSWLIPASAIFGLLCGRSRYRLFLALLIGVGVFFSMGLHPPTGALYGWLVDHVPLWWIVRSPYFKFMFLTCLGYALAIGLACVRVTEWGRQRRLPFRLAGVTVALGMIASHLIYAAPFVLGKMYSLPRERSRLPPSHIEIPSYVADAASWLNHQAGFFRIYHLPAKPQRLATWGYGAAHPILLHWSTHPLLFEYRPSAMLYAQGATNEAQALTQLLSKALYEGHTNHLAQLLQLLNVRYILHETDLVHDFYQAPGLVTYDAPPFIRAALARQTGITRGPTFGAWELSEVSAPRPPVYYVPAATLVVGDVRALLPLTQTAAGLPPALVLTATTPAATVTRLLAAHAVDQVVLTPDTPLPAALPATLPITLVASTLQLTRQVAPAQARPLMPTATGFRPPDAAGWQALESNSAPNWGLVNTVGGPQPLQLAGTVRSPQQPRSLFAYLDQQLLAVYPIPAETPTPVVVNLTLSSGTHILAWYSPDARTLYPDGSQVGFFFADDWRAGPPAYQGTWQVPRAGNYTLELIPGALGIRGDTPKVSLGSHPVVLQPHPVRAECFIAGVALPSGPQAVMLQGIGDTPYALLLTPVGRPSPIAPPLTSLTARRAAPTTFRFSAPPGPGWVIVSEAYHPGWALTGAPGTLHVPVNGFANGYYVATPPSGPMTVTFTPQRWVWVGLLLSGGTLGTFIMWRVSSLHPRAASS